jgi:ribosomal protein L37E
LTVKVPNEVRNMWQLFAFLVAAWECSLVPGDSEQSGHDKDEQDGVSVTSVSQEYAYVAHQRCKACGDSFEVVRQTLIQSDDEEHYFDVLTARCQRCGKQRDFTFNIGAVWAGYRRLLGGDN